jgi:hypothetical protein
MVNRKAGGKRKAKKSVGGIQVRGFGPSKETAEIVPTTGFIKDQFLY